MTHFKTILCTLAACSALSTTAFANTDKTAGSDLPKEVSNMHCMAGEWRGDATMKMGGDTVKLKVSLSCEQTSGGYGVSCKSRFEGMPSGVYEETDLFGYDPHTNTYHWFSVTNAGDTHDHVAAVPKGPTIKWKYTGKLEGKPFTEKVDFTFNKDSTRLKFANVGIVGGAKAWSMTGALEKQ